MIQMSYRVLNAQVTLANTEERVKPMDHLMATHAAVVMDSLVINARFVSVSVIKQCFTNYKSFSRSKEAAYNKYCQGWGCEARRSTFLRSKKDL